MRALPVLLALAIIGCGSDPPRITATDKDNITEAALSISFACISGEDVDLAEVENAVNALLDARDKFGDQTFTISDELQDVTVQEVIDHQADLMQNEKCAPAMRERLQD